MDPPQHAQPNAASLYQHAPCGLARTTDGGTFLAVNATLCHWLGRTAQDLVGKATLQGQLTMGGRIFHQTHLAPLLRMQGSVSEVKLEIVHADGSVVPIILNVIARQGDEGPVHEMAMFVARDRDAYERELLASRRKMQSLAEETAKLHAAAKDRALFAEQMVGIVSHDLRNPLSTIQMGAALLGRSQVNQQPVIARVTRAAERATRMVADLLDFTQARLGNGIGVAPSRMDLRQCAARAVEELSMAYPGRTLLHRHAGEAECMADADRIEQLVGNLVSNAIAYGREGTPVIVSTGVGDGTARIAVHNWGEPIPAGLQATLFQPMVRGEVDAASRSVGLGLFIVSEIAKAHGGSVAVRSTAEAGTTFEAILPAAGV